MKSRGIFPNYVTFVLASLILLFSSCEKQKDRFRNEAAINEYLKSKYFEIPEVATKLSDFEYSLLTGKKETLSSNNGKLLLINFWATWCFPCKQEMPDLEELKNQMKDEPFRILALNSGEKPIKVKRFIKNNAYTFDVALDVSRDISKNLKIVGLPTTLIIDEERKVVGRVMGPIDWKDEGFIEVLKKLIRT